MNGTRISSLWGKITVLVIICCCSLPAQAKYGGGTGVPNDPYQIWDANHMNAIGADSNDWDKHFKLMADIDLSGFTGTAFNIIGYYKSSSNNKPFTGVFDGNGHTISNFSYTSTGTRHIGLFSYVGTREANAEIKDLGLINPNIDAGTGDNVGLLVGFIRVENVTITNCYVEGGTVSGGQFVGGLLGNNYYGTITNCYATANVSGTSNYVGGLLGRNSGIITNCYSTGSVSGDWYVGGLVGDSWHGEISACYSRANVAGRGYVGGLVGDNYAMIYNCYSIGSVLGTADVGGLVGYGHGQVMACFWDTETSGLSTSVGGTGKTTAEMWIATTFTGWGCNAVWTIDEGKDYPRLWWENMPGELITIPYGLYGGGSGEPNDPYLIYTAEQLNTIGSVVCDWDKHFKLMADIDLSNFTGTSFNIIGSNYYYSFAGVFDGNGHTISNFSYTSEGRYRVGFFGYVGGKNAVIKDLGLIDPDVDARTGYYVGSLVGLLLYGTISNCYIEGGSVDGHEYVGGLVGSNRGIVTNCYATASVSGDDNVGGLVGENDFSAPPGPDPPSSDYTISNCYSVGDVSGDDRVGGLVGSGRADNVSNSFWDTQASGQSSSAGGTGKTTAEMQTASTFFSWRCASAWTIDEGNDYPRLVWENMPGELITLPSDLYGGGTGEPNDPYLIYTAEQLNTIGLVSCHGDKHFLLMADIDLSAYTGTEFNIIGYYSSSSDNKPFTGVFDGNDHTISNFTYTSTGRNGIGLFSYVSGENAEIKDLRLIAPDVDAGTGGRVGSLVGINGGNITNCYVEGGSVSGTRYVGGLVGVNSGTITNSYSEGNVSGGYSVGGLAGFNRGTITNSYSTGSALGDEQVGGLVGQNGQCYWPPPLVEWYCISGTISNCYSTGSVQGASRVGGLVGYNEVGDIERSFWDVETSGQTTSAGGTGLSTNEMQTMSTFTDAGWDFTTPVWTIDEGVDYPRLWWEISPVLHAEPEVTLGTSNTISWEPVPGANDYYTECAADANFTNIIYNTGWITETSYKFSGLELGRVYWYSVKARNSAGTETGWSNVESSLQITLADIVDAIDTILDPVSLRNENLKNALLNKINAVQQMIDEGLYEAALNKLQNDILQKTDGCAETGRPDKNDWIITCEQQCQIYPLFIETIEYVKSLME